MATVEGQGEIVLKQTSPGRGADLLDQQIIQLKAGLLAAQSFFYNIGICQCQCHLKDLITSFFVDMYVEKQ